MPSTNAVTRRFLEAVADLQRSEIGAAAFYTLDRIDVKTGALLTHVSIMMAILVVTYTGISLPPLAHLAIRFEMLAYLGVGLISLHGIGMARPLRRPADLEAEIDASLAHVTRRITAFRSSLYVTAMTTGAFVVTFAAAELLR